jgi:hypothetical protein
MAVVVGLLPPSLVRLLCRPRIDFGQGAGYAWGAREVFRWLLSRSIP